MADISYTRKIFAHTDWIDGESIVQASSENGFNVRFHGLEHELDAISAAFVAANTAIKALGAPPPPQQAKLVLTPILIATAVNSWSHQQGIAQKPPGQTGAHGMMSISLPNNVRVVSLRVIGRNNGAGSLRVILRRQALAADATFDQIARVDANGDPFDLNNPADPLFATVDDDRFKYFLVALLDNAQAADHVILSAFQITYLQ